MKIGLLSDKSDKAQAAKAELIARYDFIDMSTKRARPEVIVALGGDGFMLEVLHQTMHRNVPIYGMNLGTVGFLMNTYSPDGLLERIEKARKNTMHPLSMYARTMDDYFCRYIYKFVVIFNNIYGMNINNVYICIYKCTSILYIAIY